jgi:hypothetical protein
MGKGVANQFAGALAGGVWADGFGDRFIFAKGNGFAISINTGAAGEDESADLVFDGGLQHHRRPLHIDAGIVCGLLDARPHACHAGQMKNDLWFGRGDEAIDLRLIGDVDLLDIKFHPATNAGEIQFLPRPIIKITEIVHRDDPVAVGQQVLRRM